MLEIISLSPPSLSIPAEKLETNFPAQRRDIFKWKRYTLLVYLRFNLKTCLQTASVSGTKRGNYVGNLRERENRMISLRDAIMRDWFRIHECNNQSIARLRVYSIFDSSSRRESSRFTSRMTRKSSEESPKTRRQVASPGVDAPGH